MGLQHWRQREEVSTGLVEPPNQAQTFRAMPEHALALVPPYLVSLVGWPEGPLRFSHFSPVSAQVLISSLGPGSLYSTPKATSYNTGPILPCLRAFCGKRGSK